MATVENIDRSCAGPAATAPKWPATRDNRAWHPDCRSGWVSMRRLPLYWRIVLPFVLGVALVGGAATAVSTHLLGRDAETRLDHHLRQVAASMATSGFALNQPILDRLKVAVGADVLVLAGDRGVTSATLPPASAEQAAAALTAVMRRSPALDMPVIDTLEIQGRRYRAIVQTIAAAEAPSVLALLAPLEAVDAARAQIARTLVLVSLGGLVFMLLWGHLLTRALTRALGRLVESTRAVAGGDRRRRADDFAIAEFRTLAASFDDMVERIRESETRLVRSERLAATGQIVATVAHEVRNPLAAMRMLTQLLARYHAAGTQPGEACRNILAEIDRLEMLVTGLLDATHGRALAREPVSLASVLEEIAGLMTPQLRHRHVDLRIDVDPTLPPITGDARALKQALLNLVLNAADAMPDGGAVRVTARGTGDGQPAGTAVLVEDEGRGLHGEAGERAFEPFFSTKPEGAGLGLAACRRIVREHGGWITLANRADRGAVATVWLPRGSGEAGSDPTAAPVLEAPWPAS